MPKQPGQSLAEYGVIAALVSVVVITALLVLGKDLNNVLSAMLGGYHGASGKSVLSNAQIQTIQPGTSATSGTIGVKLPSGEKLALNLNNGDLQTALQVDGANGVTTVMANRIAALSKQLLANGEITQQQAGLFNDLANQGHRMAGIEKLIEDAYRKNQTSIEFEGQSYTPLQLSGKLGWSGVGIGSPILQSIDDVTSIDAASRSVEMASLLSKYQALKDSGALQNPTVQKFVGSMTSQIGSISETLEATANTTGTTPASFHGQIASSLSNIDSAQICTTGTGTDSGVHCQ